MSTLAGRDNTTNKQREQQNMCKFISSFPKHSNIIGAAKRNPNLEMFLQPCKDERTYYRVRLLGIGSTNGRDDPHITRAVHKAWSTDPKTGKKKLEKIVCSKGTPWIETDGPKNTSCKICNYAGQQWSIYNESGKTDAIAKQKAVSCTSSFEAIVPVYVRQDPNYERNNGKFRVIVFTDKDTYMNFRKAADKKCHEVNVFNGGKAVDCLIHVSQNLVEGKNGNTYKRTEIDKIKFSTEPYEIPAINSKNVDGFPFDDTYYVSSDEEEINAFYNKFCAISNDDIPEDDDIPVYKTDNSSSAKPAENKMTIPSNDTSDDSDDDISSEDLNDLVGKSDSVDDLKSDPDDLGLDDAPSSSAKTDDIDSDGILKELGL